MLAKPIICGFLIILSGQIFGQDPQDSILDNTVNALLRNYTAGTATPNDIKEIRANTYQIQNIGFVLFERSRNYEKSLEYINKALAIWIKVKDSSNEANLHKFKGVLLAHLHNIEKAKKEETEAIRLFQMKQIDFGVAVSELDFAKVYELSDQYDSAIYFARQSLRFWKPKADTFRILTINNQLMSLFLKTKRFGKAGNIQIESRKLLGAKSFPYTIMLDYYYLSAKIFEKLKSYPLSSTYYGLYESKIKDLKKENILAKSEYDNSYN